MFKLVLADKTQEKLFVDLVLCRQILYVVVHLGGCTELTSFVQLTSHHLARDVQPVLILI